MIAERLSNSPHVAIIIIPAVCKKIALMILEPGDEAAIFYSMFKFFPAELWQVASNVTSQGLWVGHREGM